MGEGRMVLFPPFYGKCTARRPAQEVRLRQVDPEQIWSAVCPSHPRVAGTGGRREHFYMGLWTRPRNEGSSLRGGLQENIPQPDHGRYIPRTPASKIPECLRSGSWRLPA